MLHTRILTTTALCAALTTALAAQTSAQPAANRFIPENSALVIRVASPAKWRQQFGTTQAAKLLHADSLAPFVGMASQQIEAGIEMLRDSGMFDGDLAEGLLNSWQGDIIISAQVAWDELADAMEYGEAPAFSFVIALTPDGSFDLAAVAKEFGRMIEAKSAGGDNLKDLVVGDLTLRFDDNDGEDPDVALPTMIDDHLVMIGGSQLEEDAAKLIAKDSRFAAKTDGRALFAHVELGKLIDSMLAMDMQGGPFDPAVLLDILGFSSLQGMTMTLHPTGKSVVGEVRLGLKKQGRGLFNAYPSTTQRPKLLSSIPVDSDAFSASPLDVGPIYATVADLWTMLEDIVPITFDEMIEGFTEATKVRLKEDLIDHIGKEMIIVQNTEALKDMDLLDESPTAFLNGSVYGFALNNGKAFAESLEKMIRSRGMHVGRKKEDYANVKINRMKIAGLIDLEYVVDDDLLLLAIGDDEGTHRALRDVIDTRADGESSTPSIVQKHGDDFPAGWNGIGLTPLGAMFEGIVSGLQATGEFGDEMDMAAQVMKGLVNDMDRLGIGSILQVSYCDDDGIRQLFRW